MKRRAPLLLAGLLALGCQIDRGATPVEPSFDQVSAEVLQAAERGVPDQYIVVFQSSVPNPESMAGALLAAHGGARRFVFLAALRGFSATLPPAAVQAIARNPNVAWVEQDQEVTAIGTQSMDSNGDPWGLDRIDARSGLDRSYTYAGNGAGVTAYIIDTGILTTHSEFGGRAGGGFTAINDGNGTRDCHGHGTHVAGTVGGTTWGVAKAVALVPVRVLGCSGSGTWDQVIAGIDWVTANHSGPAVANMSLGGGASASVDLAVRNSIGSGVAYAIAAGNGNQAGIAQDACNYSPARVTEAMTIGATDKSDVRASWSNYGNCVDWFAPGVAIRSAWSSSNTATNTISGTSMATPHTTGVAALYLQGDPAATPQQVRDALFGAATPGVVKQSKTANNNLLYSPPGGFGVAPPPPPPPPPAEGPVLSASSSKTKGTWSVVLSWSGFESGVTTVNVLRNGAVLAAAQPNTGSYTDTGKGGGTSVYQVCATGSGVCTNPVTVSP